MGRIATFLALGLCSAVCAQPAEKEIARALEREPGLRERIGREWLALAGVSVAKGARTQALEALKRARTYQADELRVASLERRAASLGNDAEPEDAAVTKRRKTVHRNVCRCLDQLALLPVGFEHAERMERYLWRAFELGRDSKRIQLLRKLATRAVQWKNADQVRRLASKATDLDPEGVRTGKWLPMRRAMAMHSRVRIKASSHPMEAFVLLPRQWSDKRKWPVVVHLAGPKRDDLDLALNLRESLQRRPYIVVVPFIRSNQRELEPGWVLDPGQAGPDPKCLEDYDVPGLKAVIKDVQKNFAGEKKFAITGFSVGSMLAYWWAFQRPQDLWAVAPTSGHFDQRCSRRAVKAAGGGPAIRILLGAEDVRGKHRRFPQNEQALKALRKLGHRNASLVKVPNRAHEPFSDLVLKFLDGVVATR